MSEPLEPDDLYLDCEPCEGTGKTGYILSPGGGICETCEGRGMKLTESGAVIFNMVRLFMKDVNVKR